MCSRTSMGGPRIEGDPSRDGPLIRDGYWVGSHLSMMPYTQSDRQIFPDFVDAIRIEPKPR
jgi:hypothetical protein